MNKAILSRSMAAVLTLTMTLGQIPAGVQASEKDGICKHHPVHTTDCGYETEGVCAHVCSLANGCMTLLCTHEHVATCFDTEGNSLCRHNCENDSTCGQTVTNCLHIAHGSCGHEEGKECEFAEKGCTECEKETSVTAIVGTDVTIDGYRFPYTGEQICPPITVTVAGTVLKENEHYTLKYENNVEAGTASVTVSGMEEAGYTGIVTIEFTIEKPVEETKPEETQPEETQPEETKPEETQPEETKPVEYTITKGDGVKWYQGSGKHLTFTLSVEGATGVTIEGKALGKEEFAVSGKTLTLNKAYLNKLTVGKYTMTVRFADGEAKGSFTVSKDLDTTNPVTGEQYNVGLWVTGAAVSLAALGAAVFVLRKKNA